MLRVGFGERIVGSAPKLAMINRGTNSMERPGED